MCIRPLKTPVDCLKKYFLRFFSLAGFMLLELVLTKDKKGTLSWKTVLFVGSAGTFGPEILTFFRSRGFCSREDIEVGEPTDVESQLCAILSVSAAASVSSGCTWLPGLLRALPAQAIHFPLSAHTCSKFWPRVRPCHMLISVGLNESLVTG